MKRTSKWQPVKQIIGKELRRVFLDKKLVFALFILPLVITVGMYSLIGILVNNQIDEATKHQDVVYLYNLPEELQPYIDQVGYTKASTVTSDKLEECKEAIRQGDADLLVTFDMKFSEEISSYKKGSVLPEVKTYYNPSEDTSNNARSTFVNQVLTPYKDKVLEGRLGDMDVLTVFDIDKDEASSQLIDTGRATGKMLGSVIPYMVTIFLFAGAMSLCVDSITGEKERGTLTSLLISPITRGQLVMGKMISLSILSCLSALTYAASMLIVLPYTLNGMMDGDSMGLKIVMTAVQLVELLLMVLALVYLYVIIVSLVAVFAKSTKEASGYISPLYMVIVVAGMVTMFQGDKLPALGEYAIPVYGTAKAIQSILTSELTFTAFAVNLCATLGVSALLTALIIKAFKSEKLMLNA